MNNEAVYQCTRCHGIHTIDLHNQPCTAEAPKQRLHTDKLASYLQQENEVLIERVRLLEIALSSEREACAKVAEEYGIARYLYEAEGNGGKQDAKTAAEAIAQLIRGRAEK